MGDDTSSYISGASGGSWYGGQREMMMKRAVLAFWKDILMNRKKAAERNRESIDAWNIRRCRPGRRKLIYVRKLLLYQGLEDMGLTISLEKAREERCAYRTSTSICMVQKTCTWEVHAWKRRKIVFIWPPCSGQYDNEDATLIFNSFNSKIFRGI